jgi:hypothetical protein
VLPSRERPKTKGQSKKLLDFESSPYRMGHTTEQIYDHCALYLSEQKNLHVNSLPWHGTILVLVTLLVHPKQAVRQSAIAQLPLFLQKASDTIDSLVPLGIHLLSLVIQPQFVAMSGSAAVSSQLPNQLIALLPQLGKNTYLLL